MGCFLGCFGDAKDRTSRRQRIHREDCQVQQKIVGSFQQQSVLLSDQSITETPPPNLVSELQPEGEEQQLSPSPRKRVTFNSNITTYEHYQLCESTDSLPEGNPNDQKEKEKNPRSPSQPLFEDENPFKSCVVSYPPNHRYYNARDSDDEAEDYRNVQKEKERNPRSPSQPLFEDENPFKSCVVSYPPFHRYHDARDSDDEAEDYSDSDLDDLDDDYEDEDDIDCTSYDQEMMWPGSTLIQSFESITENQSAGVIKNTQLLEEDGTLGSKSQARNRSDYVNSVLNPVENVRQWKAAKSKGTCFLKSQKENNQSLLALSVRCNQFKNSNQEIAVDSSLSNWLVSSESTLSKKD